MTGGMLATISLGCFLELKTTRWYNIVCITILHDFAHKLYAYPAAEHILALSEQKLTEQGSLQLSNMLLPDSEASVVEVLVQLVFKVGADEGNRDAVVVGDSVVVEDSVV